MRVREGDVVEIVTNRVGQAPRRGRVERVVQATPLKCEVAWEDGHTTLIEAAGGNLRVISRTGAEAS